VNLSGYIFKVHADNTSADVDIILNRNNSPGKPKAAHSPMPSTMKEYAHIYTPKRPLMMLFPMPFYPSIHDQGMKTKQKKKSSKKTRNNIDVGTCREAVRS
jgi:hypothetical protein